MKRRMLAVSLVVVIICLSSASALAATKLEVGGRYIDNGISFELLPDKTIVICPFGEELNKKDVKIPAKIYGYKVSTIMTSVSFSSASIKSLTIPEGVTTLELGALSGISYSGLSMPSTLANIGEDAFLYSRFGQIKVSPKNPVLGVKDGFLYNKKTGYLYCFPYNTKQKNVVMPDVIKSFDFGSYGVLHDTVEKITLSPNLEDMSRWVGVTEKMVLNTFVIPKGMKKIPEGLVEFAKKNKKVKIEIEKGNSVFILEDGIPVEKSKAQAGGSNPSPAPAASETLEPDKADSPAMAETVSPAAASAKSDSDQSQTNAEWVCPSCGKTLSSKFCPDCGTASPTPLPADDSDDVSAQSAPEQSRVSGPMAELFDYAKSVAAVLANRVDEPVPGDYLYVKINNKAVKVHAEFKYVMDVYYEYYKEYMECLSNPYDLFGMTALINQATVVETALGRIDNMELSDGDMAYYVDIHAEILKLMGGI